MAALLEPVSVFIIGVRSLFVCFQKKRPQRQADREGLCVLPPKGFCRGMGKLSPRQIRQPSKTLSPGTLLCQSSVTDHNGGTGRAAASLTASRGKDASVTAGDGEVGAGEEAPRGKARGLLVTGSRCSPPQLCHGGRTRRRMLRRRCPALNAWFFLGKQPP